MGERLCGIEESLWTLASEGLGIRCQVFLLKAHGTYDRLTSLGLNFLIPNNGGDIYFTSLLWGGLNRILTIKFWPRVGSQLMITIKLLLLLFTFC